MDFHILKKNGNAEKYNEDKIKTACLKSADRAMIELSDNDLCIICNEVKTKILNKYAIGSYIPVNDMHAFVENTLVELYPPVGNAYRQYRNYKIDFVNILDEVYKKSQALNYIGDVSNANTDSTMVSTQRSLIYGHLSKELYKKFFLNSSELQAIEDGYIYIHDMKDRLQSINCCLWDIKSVLKGGFEMGNVWYNEPKTLDVAFDVISDITISAASNQYGGFTLPEIDSVLAPYAELSYKKYVEEFLKISKSGDLDEADEYASKKVRRDFEQGFQSWEYRFNTVGSSRGDYPFVSISFGIDTSRWGLMASEMALKVRAGGQGKKGFKKPVLFPKLTFLYDERLHGKNAPYEWLYDIAIDCSSKAAYPDYLSLSGEGYIPSIYKKYGKVISLMGCVDGQELVTYKFNNRLYVQSFKRMWDMLSDYYEPKEQIKGVSEHLYLDTSDGKLEIYDTMSGFVKVKKVIRNTSDNWCKVKLEHGRQLLCTTDHPFHTNRGRIFAKDLNNDDVVNINNSQYSEENINFQNEKAWLLGLILCDGNYTNNVKVSIAMDSENDIEEAYKSRMKKCFNTDVKTVLRMRGIKGKYKDLIATNNNIELTSYLSYKFYGKNKINRRIPNEVFVWDYEAKLSFLAGMIDADGYINRNGSVVQIGSINKELSLQQMALAQSLGMFCKVYENHYNKSNENKIRYRVEFIPTKDLLKFIVSQKKKGNCVKDIEQNIYSTSKVISVTEVNNKDFSYDVETESDHFEVSGIYSHNCRASLSPWYEKGGMTPLNDDDKPVFVGRCNLGAISLNLPMIYKKAEEEGKDFYEVLDYYLELIRGLHKKTFNFLSEKKAGTNPLAFTQGGLLNGYFNPDEKIGKDFLRPMTMSFGITALNELQRVYNGKSIAEDGAFCLEVMEHINKKVAEYKEKDNILYAIYGTPAESLCFLQVKQFRNKYGVIKNVSDRDYFSNSFHCHVAENISGAVKQDLERRFWNLFNGGKIQYCRYPINYNKEAIKSLVTRAMKYGFYEGVNMEMCYCDKCGYQQLEMKVCPKCGSEDITEINRVCGYLGYSKIKGKTRFNEGKMAEVKDRVSM